MSKLGISETKSIVNDSTYKDAISCEKLTLVSNNDIVKTIVPDKDTRDANLAVFKKYIQEKQYLEDRDEEDYGFDIDAALAKYNKPQW